MATTRDRLERSWSAISPEIAAKYLKGYGAPSLASRQLLTDVLTEIGGGKSLRLLDLGCGNGQLYEFFHASGLPCRYTGVDFSDSLLAAARAAVGSDPNACFVRANIETLEGVVGDFDVAVYSHVVEMLSSPEASLTNARRLAGRIAIRFFEPPDFDTDLVELRELDVGDGRVEPYLRRKMSRDYYRMILAKIGCSRVDIYQEFGDKDQVHVLQFAA
jgi:ubiquinone/menaquinone biosynthesis C-methylase UbiE